MIRKATLKDVEEVKSINNSYLLDVELAGNPEYATKVEKEGFIVDTGVDDLTERISSNRIFNVYEEQGEILGFINVNKELYFPEEAENIVWLDKGLKMIYFHDEKAIELHLIAVHKGYERKGIASELFESALNELKTAGYSDLFSIVTSGPVTNRASIAWHTKKGFERACVTTPFDIFGIRNYQSILFHKKI